MPALDFARPLFLVLLAVPPLLGLWGWTASRRRRGPALLLSSVAGLGPLRRSPRRRALPVLLRLLAICAIAVAAAGPRAGRADALVEAEGIDIMLALDTSRSMLDALPDVADSRPKLEIAREVLDRFVAGRKDDRVGLVQFQAAARIASPLTLDQDALRALLRDVRNGLLPEGTAVGLGVASSVNALRESAARSRVVVLLTDGQNNSGDIGPIEAARLAKALGIRLYTIGLARPRTPDSDELQDVDERTMREMSRLTGGRYFPATDPTSLEQIYRTIGELERSRVGERRFTAFNEYAPYALVAALVLLVVEQVAALAVARRSP